MSQNKRAAKQTEGLPTAVPTTVAEELAVPSTTEPSRPAQKRSAAATPLTSTWAEGSPGGRSVAAVRPAVGGEANADGAVQPPAYAGGPALAFSVAGQRYGLPIENVVQIVEIVAISRLPAAPKFVVGVIDFHGQVIPVIDVRRLFGLPTLPYTLRTPMIISQLSGRQVGLIVDDVSDVVELGPQQFERTTQIVSEQMLRQTRFLSGVARMDDGLLLLLDPTTLFSGEGATFVQGGKLTG